MFCSKCGSNIEQGAAFCSGCGAPVARSNMQQQNEQTSYGYQQYGQQQYTQPNVQQQYGQSQYGYPMYSQPMAWFKFLIYFYLFFVAFLNVLNSVSMFLLSLHNYWYYIIPCVLSLSLEGVAIYVRFRLAGYYKNGPSMLLVMYLLFIFYNLIFNAGLIVIGKRLYITDIFNMVISAIGTVIIIILNKLYFDKRKHLFVK